MFSLILFLLIGHTPTIIIERHDIIEINDVYTITDEGYSPSITQIIWWDYDHISNRHEIADWRLVQISRDPTGPRIETTHTPIFSATQKMYVNIFWDKKDGIMRRISAPVYIRTAYELDIEMLERRILEQDQRRGLSRGAMDVLRKRR